MANKLALTIIVSIILTVLIISTVNVGISLFFERPDYADFCGEYKQVPSLEKNNTLVCTADAKECPDGSFVSRQPEMGCEFPACSDEYATCNKEWEAAENSYNQKSFYVFAILGFALLLIGLFIKENLIQITGLASGGILVAEGIVTNLQNKWIVFTSLIAILVIFGVLAYRIINRK